MSRSSIAIADQAVFSALSASRVASASASGQVLIDRLLFLKQVIRQAEHDALQTVAQLDSDGEFVERGVRPAAGVADLLRCTPVESRRMVAVAASVFPTSLAGVPLEPRLPATATALGGWEIDRAHAEVIERALSSDAAARLDPEVWASVEAQLADWARLYRPDELAKFAAKLIECLDQDGPPPDDEDQQVNELHLAKSRTGGGGRIKGTLDAATFDVFARAIQANLTPAESGDPAGLGRDKTLGERQAEALGAICERVLDGSGQPLDVGREKRCVAPAQRKAIAARDGGCAHPGCDRTPRSCQVHHILHWLLGGKTDIDNLVMLCREHHRTIHDSGWIVRIRDGHPEFIPPRWLDLSQTPRRNARALVHVS